MADFIDRQKLIDYFYCAGAVMVYGNNIPAIISRIEVQPAADVVEVVRCRDCKNCEEYERCNGYHCTMHDRETFLDDFCSYGDRKEHE